jgi:glucokinase
VLTVGVDVGGTSVRAGLVDSGGAVLATRQVATPADDAALEDAVAGVVTGLADAHQVCAAGLAVAGFVSRDRRRVGFSPHLPWRDVAVAERIERRLGMPVLLEHDANAAALAEYRMGAAAGGRVALLVVLGTGIGGALLLDGELFRGAHGVAPELGHLQVVPDGRPCPCGKRGCWERYCSGTALETTALELREGRLPVPGPSPSGDSQQMPGRHVALAAEDGDPVARRAMSELARWLGSGLALIADVYDPDVVVIGGGVSESAPLFLDEAREHYVAQLTGSGYRPPASIRIAQFGPLAGIVGAALLARSLI